MITVVCIDNLNGSCHRWSTAFVSLPILPLALEAKISPFCSPSVSVSVFASAFAFCFWSESSRELNESRDRGRESEKNRQTCFEWITEDSYKSQETNSWRLDTRIIDLLIDFAKLGMHTFVVSVEWIVIGMTIFILMFWRIEFAFLCFCFSWLCPPQILPVSSCQTSTAYDRFFSAIQSISFTVLIISWFVTQVTFIKSICINIVQISIQLNSLSNLHHWSVSVFSMFQIHKLHFPFSKYHH